MLVGLNSTIIYNDLFIVFCTSFRHREVFPRYFISIVTSVLRIKRDLIKSRLRYIDLGKGKIRRILKAVVL